MRKSQRRRRPPCARPVPRVYREPKVGNLMCRTYQYSKHVSQFHAYSKLVWPRPSLYPNVLMSLVTTLNWTLTRPSDSTRTASLPSPPAMKELLTNSGGSPFSHEVKPYIQDEGAGRNSLTYLVYRPGVIGMWTRPYPWITSRLNMSIP